MLCAFLFVLLRLLLPLLVTLAVVADVVVLAVHLVRTVFAPELAGRRAYRVFATARLAFGYAWSGGKTGQAR